MATVLASKISIPVGIVTGILTVVVLMFCEILPKNISIAKANTLALFYGGIIGFLMKVFTPLIFIFDGVSGLFMRLFGIDANAKDAMTESEFLNYVDASHEDGVIEDCVDLDDPEHGTTGFFARILAGGWRDWEEGMDIQSSGDAVVSEGRIYRSNGPKVKVNYTSTVRPTHLSGTVVYPDGITWTMSQDRNICHSCGVRNVVFRDIRLAKKRPVALCLHFDHDQYSRSYYPYAEIPVQSNIVFERVSVENEIPCLIQSRTPVDSIIVRDSKIGSSQIRIEIFGPYIVHSPTPGTRSRTGCMMP